MTILVESHIEKVLAENLGKKVQIISAKRSKIEISEGIACTITEPWATCWISNICWISNKFENPEKERQYGVLRYASANQIVYAPGTVLALLDRATPTFGICDEEYNDNGHSVIKGDNISGLLYRNFAEYLQEAGILPPK